jgi:hypothetical protein
MSNEDLVGEMEKVLVEVRRLVQIQMEKSDNCMLDWFGIEAQWDQVNKALDNLDKFKKERGGR